MTLTFETSIAVGANVRKYRRIQRLTQRQLAARCGCLSHYQILKIERGRPNHTWRAVTVDELVILAKALGVSVAMLLPPEATEGLDRDGIAEFVREALALTGKDEEGNL